MVVYKPSFANIRNTTDVLAPTDAKASIPRNLPTIAASTSE